MKKENLVYSWKWNDKKIEDFKKSGVWFSNGDNYHCKDQQAITFKNSKGEICLKDTYCSSEPFIITSDKFNHIDFVFKADLDDYNEIDLYEFEIKEKKYEPNDLLCLRCQGGYSNRYFVKKDSKPSASHRILVIKEEIEQEEKNIQYAKNRIDRLSKKLEELTTP